MKLRYRGVNYEYNPPINTETTLPVFLGYTDEKSRWLFLEKEKSLQRRRNSILMRQAQEIGLT